MGQVLVGTLAAAAVVMLLFPAATGVANGQELPATVDVPQGAVDLGTINLPRRVMANGQNLSAGEYEVRLTAAVADPETVGALNVLERWVEFRQGDDVRGREVVTIIPADEIADVSELHGPGSGSSRVEVLKENEYLRVWINQDGTHYLLHLVVG